MKAKAVACIHCFCGYFENPVKYRNLVTCHLQVVEFGDRGALAASAFTRFQTGDALLPRLKRIRHDYHNQRGQQR